jgi:hypothetical protein
MNATAAPGTDNVGRGALVPMREDVVSRPRIHGVATEHTKPELAQAILMPDC